MDNITDVEFEEVIDPKDHPLMDRVIETNTGSTSASHTPPPRIDESASRELSGGESVDGSATQIDDEPPAMEFFETEADESPTSDADDHYGGTDAEMGGVGEEDYGTTEDNHRSGEDSLQFPVEVSEASAKESAKWLTNIFCELAPEATHAYSKISENSVIEAVKKGKLKEESLDIIRDINESNKDALQVKPEYRQMIEEPLAKLLEIKNVEVKPEHALIIGLLIVCGVMFMTARTIRKDNERLITKLFKENNIKDVDHEDVSQPEEEVIPEVEVEDATPSEFEKTNQSVKLA